MHPSRLPRSAGRHACWSRASGTSSICRENRYAASRPRANCTPPRKSRWRRCSGSRGRRRELSCVDRQLSSTLPFRAQPFRRRRRVSPSTRDAFVGGAGTPRPVPCHRSQDDHTRCPLPTVGISRCQEEGTGPPEQTGDRAAPPRPSPPMYTTGWSAIASSLICGHRRRHDRVPGLPRHPATPSPRPRAPRPK